MLGIGSHVVGYDRRPSRLLPQPCAARSLHLLISVISSLVQYPMTVIVTVRLLYSPDANLRKPVGVKDLYGFQDGVFLGVIRRQSGPPNIFCLPNPNSQNSDNAVLRWHRSFCAPVPVISMLPFWDYPQAMWAFFVGFRLTQVSSHRETRVCCSENYDESLNE
jgi:hypothetical protein